MRKICEKTNIEFKITKEDLEFFKKLNIKTPKLSPIVKIQQLMSFRNERNFYKSKCAFSGKNIISIYPPDTEYTIFDQKIWWSDKWDPLDYGENFDFSHPFFEQFEKLIKKVPRINLQNRNNENSEYCNDTNDLKNCYLCTNATESQDCLYSNTSGYNKDCIDVFWSLGCELCYECTKVMTSYNCFWCFNSNNLNDCYFCEECQSCKNCFGCVGLNQKQYYIHNKQISKNEYEKFINNFNF